MNNKLNATLDLGKIFQDYCLQYKDEDLVTELGKKMHDYFLEADYDNERGRRYTVDESIYFAYAQISFIDAQFIDYKDYEPLFIRCLEIINKIIAEKITDHESMPEYQKFREDVKEFMGRMIDSPKYRDRFKSFPEGFD
ncbi:MAG: hypothetical protein B7Y39_02165 [Bdellovibrio sp. 28-41-41]|nr:MAG: hypothetical protein B7Y39_02165 [Bdellovibrio sp. 28-41-41]